MYRFSHLIRVSLAVAVTCSAVWLHAQSNNQQYVTAQAAVAVVGQKNYSDNIPGAAADQVGTVGGIAIAGNQLIVCDGGTPFSFPNNNRILIFPNLSALTAGQAATVVIGQPDFTTTTPGLSQTTLNMPIGIGTDGRRLAVADSINNRVLLFNQIPTVNGAAADVVVGQVNFTSNVSATNATGLRVPQGVFLDGQRLMVADTLNHRVLIYNAVPGANGAKADLVIGQADVNSNAEQAASTTSLLSPTSVFFDGTRLIVTDLGHNRVLIYNHLPTSNNAAADVVIGQPDFTSGDAGFLATGLNFPRAAVTDGTRLFIADTGNNRVLVYNTIPTTNGAAADAALGQRDFITEQDIEAIDPARLTPMLLGSPMGLAATPSSLWVAAASDRRVLEFTPGVPLFHIGSVVNAASFAGNGLGRPTNVQVAVEPDDTSTLPAGTYFIKVATQGGLLFESSPSQEVSVTIPEKSKMVVTFDEVPDAAAYRAYVGLSPGGESFSFDTASPAVDQPIDRTITINTIAGSLAIPPQLYITPGAIESLFGADLASETITAQSIPLPTTLGGTSVLVNGIPAPLFFVSPNQINFQTPWEVKGTYASVVVRKTSPSGAVTLSTAVPVAVSNSLPGVFTLSGDGTGRLLAFHSDYTLVDDEHPVIPGEMLIFFATGIQDVDVIPPTGAPSPVSNITTTLSVTMKSFGVNVLYSGLAPGFVGVFQFNVQVPPDVPADGTPTDVTMLVASIPANRTTLPVSNPTGVITIGPAPDFVVTWLAAGFANAQVFVSVDGGEEKLWGEGLSGSGPVGFIQSGHVYQFILRSFANSVVGDIIATTTLDMP